MNENNHKYDDIINLPHPVSKKHPQMSFKNRAAQFSPFAALTGYEGQIKEEARLTHEKIELSENEKAQLDQKFQIVKLRLSEHPYVSITHFTPDTHKTGGEYVTSTGAIKKINLYERKIILYAENGVSDGCAIAVDDILEINGELFRDLE